MPESGAQPADAGRPEVPKRSNRGTALERARKDLDAGRPDIARDRLSGYLYTQHRSGRYDQAAYLLYGDALFAMRDLARAGAAWLLTEKTGPDFDTATAAFHTRFGRDPVNVLRVVKPHAPSEDYPPVVQARLKSWDYRYRPYRPRSNPHAITEHSEDEATTGLRPVEFGCIGAAVIFALLFAVWLWMSFRRQ